MKKKRKKNPADLTLRKKKQQDNTKSQLVEILESHERRIQKLELVYTTLLDPTVVDKEVKKFLKGFTK